MHFLKRHSFKINEDVPVSSLLDGTGRTACLGTTSGGRFVFSALNTPPELASAQVFATVLRDSIAGPPGAADVLLPKVDLSRLFPEPASEYLVRHGGELRTNAPVRELGALRQEFGAVIVAVGPHQLKTLLPELAPEYDYQPIYTCYLQYDEGTALGTPMLGFAGGLLQWAFDRAQLTGERGLIACVISAQGDHQQMTQEELAATCHRELKQALPGLPDARWSRVIAEKRATIACVPACTGWIQDEQGSVARRGLYGSGISPYTRGRGAQRRARGANSHGEALTWNTASSAPPASWSRRSPSAPAPSAAATSSSKPGARATSREATRLVDICLEAGLCMFDSADGYSNGLSEEILGKAVKGRRNDLIISTKGSFGAARARTRSATRATTSSTLSEASLRRLGTDYIDLYQLHAYDALTPEEESLGVLDDLVRAGKIRYVGCSNFSGWHLMKSLAVSEKYGLARYVAHQAYYSLAGRDYEWELMPLAVEQKLGTVVWSPLGWGRLGGKLRRGQPLPADSRLQSQLVIDKGPPVPNEHVFRIVDAIDAIAKETGKKQCADRAQLAAAAPFRVHADHRRAQRGAAAPEPRRGRLEPEQGPDREAGCGEHCDAALPLLAPAGNFHRPQSTCRLASPRRSSWPSCRRRA
jgi:aryl-alcohol dehydrogenase-like predicted oxidoreductase